MKNIQSKKFCIVKNLQFAVMRKTRQSKKKMANEDGDGESLAQTIGEKEGEGDGVDDPARAPDNGAGESNTTPEVDRLNLMPEDDELILEDREETEEGQMMVSGNPMIGSDPPHDDEEDKRLLMIDEGGNEADEGVEGDEMITDGASSDSELFGNCLDGVDKFDETNHSVGVDAAGEVPADKGLQLGLSDCIGYWYWIYNILVYWVFPIHVVDFVIFLIQ